jgi:O-antigen/teichoic acid export membrane protein
VLANAMNYLYQLFMGRMLGPEQYGVLGALFSLLYIVMVAANSITSTVSRFVTEFKTNKEYGKIKSLLVGILKRTTFLGVLLFLLMFLFRRQIGGFLKIDSTLLILLVMVEGVLSLVSPAFSGALNGLQRFFTTSAIGVVSAFVKLSFGVGLVLLGFGVAGALGFRSGKSWL